MWNGIATLLLHLQQKDGDDCHLLSYGLQGFDEAVRGLAEGETTEIEVWGFACTQSRCNS